MNDNFLLYGSLFFSIFNIFVYLVTDYSINLVIGVLNIFIFVILLIERAIENNSKKS